ILNVQCSMFNSQFSILNSQYFYSSSLIPHPSYLIQTFFASVKNRSASKPPSRPTPLSFIPPNGVLKSRFSQVFTQTIPASISFEMRIVRFKSDVQRVEDNPYFTELAICKASSSVSKGINVTTGPKISSWFTRH